jgi:hypothetical protein
MRVAVDNQPSSVEVQFSCRERLVGAKCDAYDFRFLTRRPDGLELFRSPLFF